MFEQNTAKPAVVLNRGQTVIVPLKTTTYFNEVLNKADSKVMSFAGED
jgi:hypothetical protein